MCMCDDSFSWERKLASVALSRSRWETAVARSLSRGLRQRLRGPGDRSLTRRVGALRLGRGDERLDSLETAFDPFDHYVQSRVGSIDALVRAGERAANPLCILERRERLFGRGPYPGRVERETAFGRHQAAAPCIPVGELEPAGIERLLVEGDDH